MQLLLSEFQKSLSPPCVLLLRISGVYTLVSYKNIFSFYKKKVLCQWVCVVGVEVVNVGSV